jgi:predicted DNA-binding transcriptional regulator AlpA
MIGVSRTTSWRMVRAGTFPEPVHITERNRGFLLEAVEAWMKARTDATAQAPDASTVESQQRRGRGGAAPLFPGASSGPAR